MNLILLYGPPAVGKLTIAKELAKLTGITLYHSHMILNDIVEIFGYDNPVRRKLEFEFKQRIVEEAALQNKSLIMTAAPNSANSPLYEQLITAVKNGNGKLCIVQMKADKNVLYERVSKEGREKKIHDTEKLESFWRQYPENLGKFFDGEQLVLDTSDMQPAEAAKKIASHFNLL